MILAVAPYLFWVIVAVITYYVAKHIVVSKADTKIKNAVKQNGLTQYWSAHLGWNCVDIGRPLTLAQALAEVKAGKSVFTVTKIQAYSLAKVAGGFKEPMQHKKHKKVIGFYNHYHISGHANGAHIWYLFQ